MIKTLILLLFQPHNIIEKRETNSGLIMQWSFSYSGSNNFMDTLLVLLQRCFSIATDNDVSVVQSKLKVLQYFPTHDVEQSPTIQSINTTSDIDNCEHVQTIENSSVATTCWSRMWHDCRSIFNSCNQLYYGVADYLNEVLRSIVF